MKIFFLLFSVNILFCCGYEKPKPRLDEGEEYLPDTFKILTQSKYTGVIKNSLIVGYLMTPAFSRKNQFRFRKVKRFLRRQRRSVGSLKVKTFLKSQFEEDPPPSPPSLVALVALDIVAALFTLNAIAALLFVSNNG